MLTNANLSTPNHGTGRRSPWGFSSPPIPPRPRYTPAQRAEVNIARAANAEPGAWKPVFPFPLSGPLVEPPKDPETARKAFALVKRALGLTTGELARYFGLKWRTVQKWEQGKSRLDPRAWTLVQLVVRSSEARQLLTLQADG